MRNTHGSVICWFSWWMLRLTSCSSLAAGGTRWWIHHTPRTNWSWVHSGTYVFVRTNLGREDVFGPHSLWGGASKDRLRVQVTVTHLVWSVWGACEGAQCVCACACVTLFWCCRVWQVFDSAGLSRDLKQTDTHIRLNTRKQTTWRHHGKHHWCVWKSCQRSPEAPVLIPADSYQGGHFLNACETSCACWLYVTSKINRKRAQAWFLQAREKQITNKRWRNRED